ncbi:hypothetical protein CkP1_0111 [Citrobacter phage CkP1]|nr:hypothetical protein CkP1_0111 [Citrobacter phage CkP1]
MNRITKLSDFVPGRVMYHVYGVSRTETEVSLSNVSKYTVLSKPYRSPNSDILLVVIKCEYTSVNGKTKRSFITHICPGDNAVFEDPERKPHNLNRLFDDVESALEFMAELKANKFSSPEDQEYADKWTPTRVLEEQMAWDIYDDGEFDTANWQ